LVAILDADKEGFLRSERSLIQTMGRAARNINGSVILYADRITNSIQRAMDVTSSRRDKQEAYNKKHGIIPRGVVKPIVDILDTDLSASDIDDLISETIQVKLSPVQLSKELKRLEKEMYKFAEDLKFEQAADTRNQIKRLRDGQFK
jgi:excinuclease ABC subunit B